MNIFLRYTYNHNIQYMFVQIKNINRIFTIRINNFSEMNEFTGSNDNHNSVIIDSTKEYCNTDIFQTKLKMSMVNWIKAQKRAVWFKVALKHSTWIPILANNGFKFHHTKNDFVMMYKWLLDTKCLIPPFAHTVIGVGAIVFNNKSEILAIKQRNSILGNWKFPGGIVEPRESLIKAVKREVKEETNINFDFKSLVAVSHCITGYFDCSDIYFVATGQATSSDIKIYPPEIADCKWIDIKEYLESKDVVPFNKKILNYYLYYQKHNVIIGHTSGMHTISKRNYLLYSVTIKDK